LPTSPYGPSGGFTIQDCGKGVFWDVHGPWNLDGPVNGSWKELWDKDDAMFHSEMGAPSASSAALIRKYKGDLKEFPGNHQNPLWNRQPWWIDWPKFVQEKGREPANLEEFVDWSQARQAAALTLAARAVKSRFPACGGLVIWMGHDSFPCTSNTAIVDFDGNPKPAALQLGRIFRTAS
jgi:beta-mannosidase